MPTVDGSRNLLTAGANYSAGDWADVGAEATLEMLAVANLNRGVDIGLGVEALARLDGTIRQYLAADLNGQAHAAARVRAQVQMPLDLFDEAGIAVRLQAIAEAAAGVQLTVGLSIGDFLALAGSDPRLRGVPMELLKIFLHELNIQGGVMAKVAASAMAYANLVATGSFIKRGNRLPGFTIAAEAGVGLKAGAGFRVIARLGVDDPRRLVRRTIDVAVDETLTSVTALLPADARPIVREASAPLKIGLRCAFELGTALAEDGGAFSAADGGRFALRLVQVGLEELQRIVLERALEFASNQLALALRELNFDDATWLAAQPQRQMLADRLRALPEEPFEATDANRTYWRNVVLDATNLATALARGAAVPPSLAEPASLIWAGAQLLMKSVERISVAQARMSVIGASPVGITTAFDGDLPAAPPLVAARINATLARAANEPVRQQNAVAFLLRVVERRLDEVSPEAASILPLLTGTGTAFSDALSVVFSNLGAFVPGPNGQVSAEASLAVLRTGLRTFINTRIDTELMPQLQAATAATPEVRLYLDEVLLSTLRTVVDAVFDTVLTWQQGGGDTQRALRELCSGLLMRLFGRSVVVTADVLHAHALGRVQHELRQLAASANIPDGVVPTLVSLTGLDRDLVSDLVEETLEVCADTFGPMGAERRARVRDLLYQMIDTIPPHAGASMINSLKAAGMVGNAEAALELTQLLGEEIAGNLLRFVQALLTRVASTLLALLADAIADIQRSVDAWIHEIELLAQELLRQLGDLLREIGQLQQALDDAVDVLLGHASRLLGGFAEHGASRNSLRGELKDTVAERALDALAAVPGYGALPTDMRRTIRRTVRGLVDGALDADIFNPVLEVLAAVSAETAELLEDLRRIEPGDDLAVAIADIALDRIEDALRDAFDGNPSVRIKFDAPLIGAIDLGRIDVPMSTFVSVARGAIRELGRFNAAVGDAAEALGSVFDLEAALLAAEHEHAAVAATRREAENRIAETREGALDIEIVQPQASSVRSGPVSIELRVPGGNASLLAGDGLSHRRVFVWVNGHELPLDTARVSSELPAPSLGARPGGASPPLPSSLIAVAGVGRVGHPLVAARARRHDSFQKQSSPARAGRPGGARAVDRFAPLPAGAGVIRRFGGVAFLPGSADGRLPQRVSFPGRTSGDAGELPALRISLDLPERFLHEGINALACALVPGAATRRVERSVSFLRVPPQSPDRGRRIMPPVEVHAPMPTDLGAFLRTQGLLRETRQIREPSRQVRRNTWVPPLAERSKAVAESRAKLRAELEEAAVRRYAVHAAIAEGVLRPRRPKRTEAEAKEKPQ